MSTDIRRVVYYSNYDLSITHNLENAEKVITLLKPDKSFSINDLLELYNIQLYFKNNLRLSSWSDELFEYYKIIVNNYEEIIKSYVFG
jgi:hypothetical protein